MKISRNWLNEFIDLSQLPQGGSDEELDVLLTNTGLEVEGIEAQESIPGGLKGFVIGTVLTCERFQVKEKTLSATTVDVGQEQALQIVCGAANVDCGQRVVVATPGTQLYDSEGKASFVIERRKVYGQWSEGMICAEDEIGIGDNHDGILVLDTKVPNGTPAAEFFQLNADRVLEIGLTPNRADAASHWGVARDIHAVSGIPIQLPQLQTPKANQNAFPIDLEVIEEACTRFCGITIDGVKVSESPTWLQERLKSIGLRPINNIVDITNYVCHGLGQPMHAYDWHQIRGQRIQVRTGKAGEAFTTLDGVERKLNGEEIMICDAQGPIGIGGIMGGAGSSIQSSTTRIFLEVAHFKPERIRRAAQHHGLKTDASFRFERGTDPEAKAFALSYAIDLVLKLAGGNVASDWMEHYPMPAQKVEITSSLTRIRDFIGVEIPEQTVLNILQALDFEVLRSTPEIRVLAPSYRVDVQREADLMEEILRIYGLDQVPLSEHLSAGFLSEFPSLDVEKKQHQTALQLAAKGYAEIMSNSLTKAAHHDYIQADLELESVEILNRLSEELGAMRQHMVFSGLEVLAHNINRRQKDLRLFEFGKTYHKKGQKYLEKKHLMLYLSGAWMGETWEVNPGKTQLNHLYQDVVALLRSWGVKQWESKELEGSSVYAYGLELIIQRKSCIRLGLVQPSLAEKFEVKQSVFMADLDWNYLSQWQNTQALYQEISKYPEVRRDLSLVIDQSVSFAQIERVAMQYEKQVLKQVQVFDVYQGANLGEGKKAYALAFTLQDEHQTLTDKIIDACMDRLMKGFEKELGAIIRK